MRLSGGCSSPVSPASATEGLGPLSKTYQFDLVRGLGGIVRAEISQVLQATPHELSPEAYVCDWPGSLERLKSLRTVVSVSRSLEFDIVRPKALLGDENLRTMVGAVRDIVRRDQFHSVRIAAAGSDSSVMRRIAERVAEAVQLDVDESDGDLVLRILHGFEGAGWRVLVRLTPRPLATRPWRVADYRGAVNATIAAAMVRLASLRSGAKVANLMCGSGTLAVETALAHDDPAQIIAIDRSRDAIAACRANVEAAAVDDRVVVKEGDALDNGLAEAGFDAVFCDPPWSGMSQAEVRTLYDATLREIARLLAPDGTAGWLSHQIEVSKEAIAASDLRVIRSLQLTQGGLHPTLWMLRRR